VEIGHSTAGTASVYLELHKAERVGDNYYWFMTKIDIGKSRGVGWQSKGVAAGV
jgi:hypothetical protein